MSFASEPGRDDGNLPPVNIVIPDDARELDRDVLAYHREQKARRRRQRLARLFGPFGRREYGGHAAILPLIATCVALSMLAGAMLSVLTISPALAPTVSQPAGVSGSGEPASLPSGTVWLHGTTPVNVRSLRRSALALVPANCDCGQRLLRLAHEAAAAHVGVYFVASGAATAELANLTTRYGGGVALPVYDRGYVLDAAYGPVGLTVLLVYSDDTVRVSTDLPPGFQLGPELSELSLPGSSVN